MFILNKLEFLSLYSSKNRKLTLKSQIYQISDHFPRKTPSNWKVLSDKYYILMSFDKLTLPLTYKESFI